MDISNDGWFEDTSAPWKHLKMTCMRAIENHPWTSRDTNNGITAIIDPRGRVTASNPRQTAGVPTAPFGYERDITLYTSHADFFAGGCAAPILLLLIPAQIMGTKAQRSRFSLITWPNSGTGSAVKTSEQPKGRVYPLGHGIEAPSEKGRSEVYSLCGS